MLFTTPDLEKTSLVSIPGLGKYLKSVTRWSLPRILQDLYGQALPPIVGNLRGLRALARRSSMGVH